MRLLFVVNSPAFFLSHRLAVALAAKDAGYEVHVATAPGCEGQAIQNYGLSHHTLPLSRSGLNPVREVKTVWSILRLFRQLQPDIVHLVTIKPVLYGGISARLVGIPRVVAAISGLGAVFIAKGQFAKVMRALVKRFYRFAFDQRNLRVIFQNPDDRLALQELVNLDIDDTVIIRGSGVNLFDYQARPEPEGVPVVTFAARLLRDKGVGEFVEAANLLNSRGVKARFWLIGSQDPGNPTSITEKELADWRELDFVEFLGYREDISEVFAKSNIVVLPSYREGLPKVLIEAAACGRAVVTTDVPGCRDAIEPGITGLLVPVQDDLALADAIELLLKDEHLRRMMGRCGRQLAEREFAIEKVVSEHLDVYRSFDEKLKAS